jgi:hypothetical protein
MFIGYSTRNFEKIQHAVIVCVDMCRVLGI